MNFDFNKIKAGMTLPVTIGLVVIVGGFFITLLLGLLSDQPTIQTVLEILRNFGNIVLSVLSHIFFLVLFVWAGYRTARRYRGDVVEAGIAGALSYAVLALINLFFDLLNAVLQITGILGVAPIGGISGSAYEDVVISLLGNTFSGPAGIAALLCCGFGRIPIGMLANFLVGSIGGLIGSPSKAA
jgi:hypothetical protein